MSAKVVTLFWSAVVVLVLSAQTTKAASSPAVDDEEWNCMNKSDKGATYEGWNNVANNGKNCLMWNSDLSGFMKPWEILRLWISMKKLYDDLAFDECRNPNGQWDSPSCFTTSGLTSCSNNIPTCDLPCKRLPDAAQPVCDNDATCIATYNLMEPYACVCNPGYTGLNCYQIVDQCASSPCQNNGNCSSYIARYDCSCINGWTGAYCNLESCARNPCAHGKCTDDLSFPLGYNCTCDAGYEDAKCSQLTDKCSKGPCQNGAACVNQLVNDYQCLCLPGYTGKNCEVDLCSSCLNGGNCTRTKQSPGYMCNCPPFFSGYNCDTPRPEFQAQLCHQFSCPTDNCVAAVAPTNKVFCVRTSGQSCFAQRQYSNGRTISEDVGCRTGCQLDSDRGVNNAMTRLTLYCCTGNLCNYDSSDSFVKNQNAAASVPSLSLAAQLAALLPIAFWLH